MLPIVVFLLLTVGAQAQFRPPQFGPCDSQELARAQKAFNDYLGLDPAYGVKTSHQLRKAVEGLIGNQGTYQLFEVCAAFKIMKTQFSNSQNYDNCFFNKAGLLVTANGTSTGISKRDSYTYQSFMNQFDFVCGAGMQVFANTDACSANVFATQGSAMDKCLDDFYKSIELDFKDLCAYVDIASKCFRNLFFDCGIAAAWFGCEYERTGATSLFPQCSQVFCTFNPSR